MSLPSFTKIWHSESYATIDPSRPELAVTGKNVLIVGSSVGIGLATARAFATAGAKTVTITGRDQGRIEAARDEVQSKFPKTVVTALVAESTNTAAVDEAFTKLQQQVGPIDIFVNNAGYLPDVGPLAKIDIDDWWSGFEINVKGSLIVTNAFLRIAAKEGAILINVSSSVGHFPFFPGYSSYAASKFAGWKLFDYYAGENPGVKVFNVQPGIVKTAMGAKSAKSFTPPGFDDVELPASFIVWITSPEAEFLRGRFAWANWDVAEMKAREQEIIEKNLLTSTLQGWPLAEEST